MFTIDWKLDSTNPDIGYGYVNGRKVVTVTQFELEGQKLVKATSYLEGVNDQVGAVERIEEFKNRIQALVNQYDTIEPAQLAAMGSHLRIEDLDRVKGLIKVKKLAELAGLSSATIAQKLGRGTQLTVVESEQMTKVLRDHGVVVTRSQVNKGISE